ncbi:MAG TPA: prepilin-type N-terminal cleavage/methylation domain-containing protein [Burkholderiaceae bacterium]|nr:prepilin-type N-terminal cleavage/methylation domain-containing protein [Burkholderiaceae bacterium]
MRPRVLAARGITLIECVIALAVVAALMSIALPSFGEAMARARLRSAAQDLALDLGNARLESVRPGAGAVHVSVRPGAGWCWAVGPAADADCHHPPQGTLHVARVDDYPGVVMTHGVDTRFDGSDTLAPAGFAAEFELPQGQQLRVQVTPLGRAIVCAPQGDSRDFPRCS